MMSKREVVLVGGARTAFTKFGGSFRDISAIDLAVHTLKEALKRANVAPEQVDHVVYGNVLQTSPDAILFARMVGLKTGIPKEVPAVTVNRVCGTGIEAIVNSARLIMTGEADVVATGGAENMSQIPHVIRGARWGTPLFETIQAKDYLWEALYDPYGDVYMADTAENLAIQYKLTREEVDAHAYESHRRALEAIKKGYFKEEIVPVTVKERKTERVVDVDEHPRETSLEELAKLKPRFRENGVVTAGNASGINDGAVGLILTSLEYAEKHGLKPLARLVSWGVAGVEPKIMGIGPVPAVRQALEKAKLTLDDMALIEINEAFSAQYLACQKELGFDPAIGNVNGGAVALGHPLAASGARLSLTLIHELHRRKERYGVASLCIGGGQGIAAVWERL